MESALSVTGAERGFLVLEEDGELSFEEFRALPQASDRFKKQDKEDGPRKDHPKKEKKRDKDDDDDEEEEERPWRRRRRMRRKQKKNEPPF